MDIPRRASIGDMTPPGHAGEGCVVAKASSSFSASHFRLALSVPASHKAHLASRYMQPERCRAAAAALQQQPCSARGA